MILRPYQTDLITSTRAAMQAGCHSLIIESPTGSGKTALTAFMLKTAAEKGIPSWFVCHRVELIRQSIETFASVGVDFGIVASGFFEEGPGKKVLICSIGTLARRMSRMAAPGLIVYDEAHHLAAKSWAAIHAAYPQAYHVGLTATPERLDGKGLGLWFKKMIKGPAVRWLIEQGYLSDYRLVVPPGAVNTQGIHKSMGDFDRKELSAAADKPTITGNAVREYLKRAAGKRAIARGVSIEHSKHIAEQFNGHGIPALHVDGDTPAEERREAMESFKRGETLVLTNVDLFSEGVDVPAVECVLDLRPTQSLTLCRQFWGRALRPAPGKEYATIIDLAGNYARHGLPCEPRQWALDGRASNGSSTLEESSRRARICPSCFGAQFGVRDACQYCGHVFATKGRVVEEKDAELVEVNLEELRAKMQVAEKRDEESLAYLTRLGKQRGYRNPHGWAKAVFNARQAKKLAKGRIPE